MSKRSTSAFVFVSQEGVRGGVVKRLKYPQKMDDLQNAIQKMFDEKQPIMSLRTDNGAQITKLTDIKHGSKILVLFRGCEADRASQSSVLSRASSARSVGATGTQDAREDADQAIVNRTGSRPLRIDDAVNEDTVDENDGEQVAEKQPPGKDAQPEDNRSQMPCLSLIGSIISCDGLDDNVAEAFESMSFSDQERVSALTTLENAQKSRYLQRIMEIMADDGTFTSRAELHLGAEIGEKARRLIAKHRITDCYPIAHIMQTAIIGPRRSGKTKLLGIVVEELLLSLVATGGWKHTFVFVFDAEKCTRELDRLNVFYTSFIRRLFLLLRAQTTIMVPYLSGIEAAFIGIVEATMKPENISLPMRLVRDHSLKHITDELQFMGRGLIELWFDPTALSDWLAMLMTLPTRIARALGFSDVIYVIDNFESSNVSVDQVYPFDDAPTVAFISEHLKRAMAQTSFIVTGRDSTLVNEILQPMTEDDIDLSRGIENVLVCDIAADAADSFDILVTLVDDPLKFKINSSICSGIPAFLSAWKVMSGSITDLEKVQEGSPDYEDCFCRALYDTEQLLLLTMQGVDSPSFEVESVKRLNKPSSAGP